MMTIGQIIAFIWRSSGGWRRLFYGLDFWVAIVVLAFAVHFWTTDKWPGQVISVLPGLLGFTLAGFTVFLVGGNSQLRKMVAESNEAPFVFLNVGVAFMNFILFQLIALLWALAAKAMYFRPPVAWISFQKSIAVMGCVGGAIGYFIFIYSLILIFRVAICVFKSGCWFNKYLVFSAPAARLSDGEAALPNAAEVPSAPPHHP